MGTLFSKQSQNMSHPQHTKSSLESSSYSQQTKSYIDSSSYPQQSKPRIDSSSYLLGKNISTSDQKHPPQLNNNFDYKRLHFIPDSERLWSSPLPTSVRKRPTNLPPFASIDYLTKMPTQQKQKCDQCGMVFPSDEALFRHKTRFCIGVKDSGIGRKPVYSDDEDIDENSYTKRSTRRKVIQHHSPIQKKREAVNDWKRQRSILQTVEDMEDRILMDTHRSQKLLDSIQKQDRIYNEILIEYERLQNQEQDVLRKMYSLQTESPTLKYPVANNFKQTNDNIKNQLEELQRKNIRLEQERRIIQQKLEELLSANYQPTAMSNYEPYKFLREMKDQEELNEKALDFLRGRLMYPESSLYTVSNIPSLPYVNTRQTQLRRTGGDSVRSYRNNYLQSGGHDANILARYTDVEYRLRTYEDYPWTKDYPEPLKQSRYQPDRSIDLPNERLKLANDENQRLQSELNEMHKKFDTLSTHTKDLEVSMATNSFVHQHPTSSSKVDLYSQSLPGNNNVQSDHHQTSLPMLDKHTTPRASPALSLLSSNMSKLRDPLAPQLYDPNGGFTIFFDFIANLPPDVQQCCVVTCLHHPKSSLGEPSQLEPFKCSQYMDERTGQRMSVALIATKQPVPRCPPQQALTVILEIQTSTGGELQANAWAKFPLFDNKNRLLSGRWKIPLKALPIRYNEGLATINTLPIYEHAELYYRLVNSQDDNDQSNAPLSPSFRDLYNYPPQYRT